MVSPGFGVPGISGGFALVDDPLHPYNVSTVGGQRASGRESVSDSGIVLEESGGPG
jgi:hypothetical protein